MNKDIKENDYVKGFDMNKKPIEGQISNILSVFQVAIIRTGEDRLDNCIVYLNDIERVEE